MKCLAFFAVLYGACVVGIARAGDCCGRCGCHAPCNKVCRVVCEIKKVPKTEYDCECEDFCVPGRSERCVTDDECGKRHCEYTPVCGHVRTRVKLIKKQTTEEKPSYKWIVEDLCCNCAAACEHGDAPAPQPEPVPQPPPAQTGAERIFGTASAMPANAVDVPLPAVPVSLPSFFDRAIPASHVSASNIPDASDKLTSSRAQATSSRTIGASTSPVRRALRPLFGGP